MEESETFETDNNMDKKTARGNEDAISDIPLGGTGTVGSIGVGGGGMAGVFGYRDGGGRKKAVGRFGGSTATESAVEAALRWLARHQEADGHWDSGKKYEGGYSGKWDAGVTGLATLAFLGAGYTHKDGGPFQDNMRRAINWMLAQQKAHGGTFYATAQSAANDHWTYDHFICTLAMAEAYGMTRDPALAESAQKGVDGVIQCQNPYSGWRYGIKTGDSDISVSGWAVMALKSAKIAGLKVEGTGFQGAGTFIDKITDPRTGRIGYTALNDANSAGAEGCTAIGMVCREFMGAPATDPLLRKQADLVVRKLPDWNKLDKDGAQQFYHWYYGTLAMFQMGGTHWDSWNKALKDTLVPNQCKGPLPLGSGPEDKDGSWDPKGWVSNYAGRVYSTALGALTLEVYYRYLPMYTK